MDDTTTTTDEGCHEEPRSERENRFRTVTIEPALFLLAFAITLASPVLQNLVVLKTCIVTLGYNSSVCSNLTGLKYIEDQIQPHSAQLFMFKSLIEAVIPAAMSFYIGPWSDQNGRKPLLLAPIFGHFVMYAMFAVLSMKFAWYWQTDYLLLASIPLALTGGFVAFVTGAFCYISDISSAEERSWRMGLAEAALLIGLPMGLVSSSFILKWGGYLAVFGTSCLFCSAATVYLLAFVPESIQHTEMSGGGRIFDAGLVRDMLRTCCKKRPGYRRLSMFLVMAIMTLIIFSLDGDLSVAYLYTREKFSWDIQDYSLYSSASNLMSTVGTLAGLHIFSKLLQVDDARFAAVSCFLKTISLMILALATQSWMMYAGSALGILAGVASALGRAILSKSVHSDDVGKVFSLTSSLEALTPIGAAPLYTQIYKATYLTVPGTFYMISSGIYLVNFFLFIAVAVIYYKFPSNNYQQLGTSRPEIN